MSLLSSALAVLPPEPAHRLAIRALAHSPLTPRLIRDPRLQTTVFGLNFANPVGLAAGFDKSAEAVDGLLRLGFGFVEVGTLTPKPQYGNPKPRLFRLARDKAIINRMGFNNDGHAAARARLLASKRAGIVGVNIGPNKDTPDRVADYLAGVKRFCDLADYLAINISSPNTPGLRDLHARRELDGLLAAAVQARDEGVKRPPVLVKISPDIADAELDDVLDVALQRRVDGLIVANTSVGRPADLRCAAAGESGGLSGRPIFDRSTRLIARCHLQCKARLPIVGVGGVEDAATALRKFRAGASLIQIYTGFIYRGPQLIRDITANLSAQLERENVSSLADIVGVDAHANRNA